MAKYLGRHLVWTEIKFKKQRKQCRIKKDHTQSWKKNKELINDKKEKCFIISVIFQVDVIIERLWRGRNIRDKNDNNIKCRKHT